MFILAGWVMVVLITDVVKVTLSVADISIEPIIGTPLGPMTLLINRNIGDQYGNPSIVCTLK